MSLTVDNLATMIEALQRQVAQLAQTVTAEKAIVLALLSQFGDPTHITVKRAAELLGVSTKTIRRRIKEGVYTLEKRPGEKEGGIPIEQIYAGWTPIGALRTAIERERCGSGITLGGQR